MFPSGAINYGGHNVPEPAPADMSGQKEDLSKLPQGQQQIDPLRAQEGVERQRRMAPAVPYGYQGENGVDGWAARRMDQYPDWDGDLRWPPPQFMADEAARQARLNAMERQAQEKEWRLGEMQLSQMQQAQHEANVWRNRGNR